MNPLSDILSSTAEKLDRASEQPRMLPRSEWEEQLDRFLERLNPSRTKKGYPAYSYERLGAMLKRAGVRDAQDAYALYRKCEGGRNFGALFETLTRKKA